MARSNGAFGPSGAALRRRPGDDPFGPPPAQPAAHWPPHPQGYGAPVQPPQSMQGYHFPPAEPGYGYSSQPLAPSQQWGQPGGDPQGYELSYQAYSAADPGPFQSHHQQSGYPDQDADYGEYFEDEEPRRGRRWILIAAALVGAIGVGGALAYTYRSLVAHPGRVPVVKADPTVKVKPDYRAAGAERKLLARPGDETQRVAPSREEPAADTANLGPRVVRSIPITPGGVATPEQAAPPVSSVPGITLYTPPSMPQPQAAPVSPPSRAMPDAPSSKAVEPSQGSVVIGSRPPSPETDDDTPAVRPSARRAPVQTAALAPKAPPAKPRETASSGLGYVAVLSSQKTSMDALKVFADLQQKYGGILGDKTPDVQEADLSARGLGTMYRVVVGPPGSHNAARSVCAQLKTAGYVGCWVKQY